MPLSTLSQCWPETAQVAQTQAPAAERAVPAAARVLCKQASFPAALGKPASLQQQPQESSMPAFEGASAWSAPLKQEVVPFVSSNMALFSHALPSGAGQDSPASRDSTVSKRYSLERPITP